MKKLILSLIICTGLLYSCKQTESKDKPEVLMQVLTSYFDGIKNHDSAKMIQHCTDDYLLFESGHVWNNDSLWQELQKYRDTRIEFTIRNPVISIDKQVGHISYFNHGDIYSKDSLVSKMDWIESAAFTKVGSEWKIHFLHSSLKE